MTRGRPATVCVPAGFTPGPMAAGMTIQATGMTFITVSLIGQCLEPGQGVSGGFGISGILELIGNPGAGAVIKQAVFLGKRFVVRRGGCRCPEAAALGRYVQVGAQSRGRDNPGDILGHGLYQAHLRCSEFSYLCRMTASAGLHGDIGVP
jgi:hypothetical protein